MASFISGVSSRAQALLNRLPLIEQLGAKMKSMEMSGEAKLGVAGMTGLLKHIIIMCAGATHIADKLLAAVKDFNRLTYSQIGYMKENFWTVGAGTVMLFCAADVKYLQPTSPEESKQTKDYIRIALKVVGYSALAYSMFNTLTKLGEAQKQLGAVANDLNVAANISNQIGALAK